MLIVVIFSKEMLIDCSVYILIKKKKYPMSDNSKKKLKANQTAPTVPLIYCACTRSTKRRV